jgi:DNA-binding CsgD family transcriptional regulator
MNGNPKFSTAIARRRRMEHIRLLCQSGTGLEAIAAPLCHAVRDLVGAKSGSIFWLDDKRAPQGFYHDCAPAEIKDIFATRLEELFIRQDEFNMMTLTDQIEPSIGRLLVSGAIENFWEGNVYNHLCVPLGHRFMLDMRIDVEGVGRALVCLWNGPDAPFHARQVEALRLVQRQIAMAIQHARKDAMWRPASDMPAQFLTDLDGETLIAIDDEAERLLQESHLLRQNLPMAQPLRDAPSFAKALAVARRSGQPATLEIPVANGRLVAQATTIRSRSAELDGDRIAFRLRLEVSLIVIAIERLILLALTPLQREIALFAVRGGERSECAAEFGVSGNALKVHIRAIYEATGVSGWGELVANLRRS